MAEKRRPDENLILRMAQGDREAFRLLYEQTSDAVYGFALSILKHSQDAEDVMHDVFLKVWQNADTYQPEGRPLSWILRIVRNQCYNRIRSGRKQDYEESPEIPDPGGQEALLDRMVLEQAMRILDSAERQIVILHALSGMKHREIAELLELPVGTVLSKYNRSLKKLIKELEGKGAIA